jgi:hypothetical protein
MVPSVSPIAKKLLIKPGMRVMVLNAPGEYFRKLEPLPEGVALVPSGSDLDVGISLVSPDDAWSAMRFRRPEEVGRG